MKVEPGDGKVNLIFSIFAAKISLAQHLKAY